MYCNIRAGNKQLPSSSPITSLPEDVVVDILARVPSCDYPRVSLVSKYFWSLVSSPEIYARRSSLGCTEHCLYAVLHDRENRVDRLYTLRQKEKENDKGLVRIPWLPDMAFDGISFVAVGSRIYVFCGMMRTSSGLMTPSPFFIDCTSHTVQPLPKMPVSVCGIVADVIGAKIYVVGYLYLDDIIHQKYSYVIEVFDTETQLWEDKITKPAMAICVCYQVVMAGKMYMMGKENSYVYDPKESKWETDEVLHSMEWRGACVVDDVLYIYDWSHKKLRAYDPEHKCWGLVEGLDELFAEVRRVGCFWAENVGSHAGKVVLFFPKQVTKEFCCAEISLERRKGGQIWGKVDQWRSDHALITGNYLFRKSLYVVL